jgi:hypothetical protein
MEQNYLNYIEFLSEEEIKTLFENDKRSFIGVIPKNIQDKKELMLAYYEKLNLAPYFGGNWDALDEVLVDFDWMNAENIIIIHSDIPQLSTEDKKMLFDVLANAVKLMRKGHVPGGSILPTGKHKLRVIFPESCRKEIESLLSAQ